MEAELFYQQALPQKQLSNVYLSTCCEISAPSVDVPVGNLLNKASDGCNSEKRLLSTHIHTNFYFSV
jgi:hypothetical protein